MDLGLEQKERLARDGYLQVPGLVPPERVTAALRAINLSLGDRGMPPDQLKVFRARSFCPELVAAPEIRALYAETPARALAEAAIGRVRVPSEGQIALRFPQPVASAAVPHIDGMYAPDNGVPAGTLLHFTALLAVFLSDVPGPDAGNFTVWPGSHLKLQDHFRRHGTGALDAGFPALPLGEPRALTGRAGDVVLAHYALAHGISANRGPHVRYAVFFRLHHAEHGKAGDRPLTDLWLQWEGMRSMG